MAGMLEIIEGEARSQGFVRVSRVVLEIGKLAGVEVEALRFAFDVSSAGTVAEGAELEIEQPDGLARCQLCLETTPVRSFRGRCPRCGGDQMRVISGKEMRIKFLDVD